MDQPYKFLDYYDINDSGIFFGRDREIETLLSDVISTRLVLLFARTGSGKTSLINAGVRPRLEKLDYRTFYVRVEKDPTESARKALRRRKLIPQNFVKKSLNDQLRNAVVRLNKPIVLFFDQFEEFFIYIYKKSPEKAAKFISTVASLYHDRASGVHQVFCFREEFFIEMDAFREKIPSIFHNDSNLRLRWFDATQASDAITQPAQKFNVTVEAPLVESVIKDLAVDERVEPARLQIVCDTLWQNKKDGHLRLDEYEQLGGALEILHRRLEKDLEQHLSDEQLLLFEKLLPTLGTERGTKYIRGFNELVKSLGTNKTSLRALIEQLRRLHLIRRSTRYDEIYIEWTSDYLAGHTDHLRQRVQAIGLRRLLRTATQKAARRQETINQREKKGGAGKVKPLTEDDLRLLYLSTEDFETLSRQMEALDELLPKEAEFMLIAALEHGNHLTRWFQNDSLEKPVAWQILKDRISSKEGRIEQAENAIRLLGELRTKRAMNLLRAALQQDVLAPVVLETLGEIRTREAMRILQWALKSAALAEGAISVLSQIRSEEAVNILASVLPNERLSLQAQGALERISKGRAGKASSRAELILVDWKEHQDSRRKVRTAPVAIKAGLSESQWKILLRRIKEGSCLPIIGPDLGATGTSDAIARRWAERYHYPFDDKANLSRVAEYIATQYDDMFVKELLLKEDKATTVSEVERQSYDMLAALPLPLYITTNYHDYLEEALVRKHRQLPIIISSPTSYQPFPSLSPSRPLVMHLYGNYRYLESLLVTDLDQFGALIEMRTLKAPTRSGRATGTVNEMLLRKALDMSILLVMGFEATDRIFSGLIGRLSSKKTKWSRQVGVVQLPLETGGGNPFAPQSKYLTDYFGSMGMMVYWGAAKDFSEELQRRWRKFTGIKK
ncbi:MAG: SIR2 family protein [Pyrinomonadaceae bacterium]